jgi:hypothetical protein
MGDGGAMVLRGLVDDSGGGQGKDQGEILVLAGFVAQMNHGRFIR